MKGQRFTDEQSPTRCARLRAERPWSTCVGSWA
jgi:hypothetical protein